MHGQVGLRFYEFDNRRGDGFAGGDAMDCIIRSDEFLSEVGALGRGARLAIAVGA